MRQRNAKVTARVLKNAKFAAIVIIIAPTSATFESL